MMQMQALQAMQQNGGNPNQLLYQTIDRNSQKLGKNPQMLKQPGQPVPFPRIQRLNEDVESNAAAALQMSSKTKTPLTPYAVQYALGNNDAKSSVFSDTSSRRSIAQSYRSRAFAPPGSVKDAQSTVGGGDQAPQNNNEGKDGAETGQNGPATIEHPEVVPEEDEQAAEKEELYDEINSLYNMENPKGEDQDDRRSQYST